MSLQLENVIEHKCRELHAKYPRMFPNGMPRLRFYSRKPKGVSFLLAYAESRKNQISFNVHPVALGNKNPSEWEDTAAHEMAHIASPGDKHGRQWQLTARIFGVHNPSRRAASLPQPREIVFAKPLERGLELYSLPREIFDPTSGKVMNSHVQELYNEPSEALIDSSY